MGPVRRGLLSRPIQLRDVNFDGCELQSNYLTAVEHRGWLVHFVIANSTEEARERGKHVEKSIRNHSRRLNDSLNDSQLMAAFAITRGNIT